MGKPESNLLPSSPWNEMFEYVSIVVNCADGLRRYMMTNGFNLFFYSNFKIKFYFN